MFVVPVLNQTIQSYLEYSDDKYLFMKNPEADSFIVSNSSNQFCSDCTYLIKIKGE